MSSATPPGPEILDTFGLAGAPAPLAGGEGRSYIADWAVLKPVDDETAATWVAEVLGRLEECGFRVARPLPSRSGRWVAHGWAASRYVEGDPPTRGRWAEMVDVGRAFHAALAGIERPAFLHTRRDPWSIADRMAWSEATVEVPERLRPLVDRLLAARRPVDLPSQIIHGDLAGNVLFAEGLAPAVIDFSPYFRPAEFASAIVIVDALAWESADESVLALLDGVAQGDQLLLRAALFRIVTAGVAFPDDTWRLAAEVHANEALVDRICRQE